MAVDALAVRARARDGVRATLLLCDYAAVAEGKLNILGAGWTTTHNVTTHAVAVLLEVPWDRTNAKMTIQLELKEQAGSPSSSKVLQAHCRSGSTASSR